MQSFLPAALRNSLNKQHIAVVLDGVGYQDDYEGSAGENCNESAAYYLNGDDVETENSFMQPRNTPENTFGISTVYTAAIGPGNLQGVLAYRYRDAIQTDLVSQ